MFGRSGKIHSRGGTIFSREDWQNRWATVRADYKKRCKAQTAVKARIGSLAREAWMRDETGAWSVQPWKGGKERPRF